MRTVILGISAYYHDSAAALLVDGEIVAAAQEERFTRIKQDAAFPYHAARYVLSEYGIDLSHVSAVAFYEKPLLKFERLLETYHAFAPKGFKSFITAIPVWIKEKLFMRNMLRQGLKSLPGGDSSLPEILFPEHHLSHAASAFFPSPFEDAAIVTVDGVGEWATTSICHGKGNSISVLRELAFPHSLGLFYSAVTAYCGFKVNSGEYKLMGLAPYGDPDSEQTQRFESLMRKYLIDIRPDGSFVMNMDYFAYATGLTMYHTERWKNLFGIPPQASEAEPSREYMNMALAAQRITEDVLLRLSSTAKELTQSSNLCMSGGVALNCVANSVLLRAGAFKNLWIQPAAGDAGGALGAALAVWYIKNGQSRQPAQPDSMHGAYLGPAYTRRNIERVANCFEAPFKIIDDRQQLYELTAELLAQGNVVGWFQGRMEYGPRALGGRSILGDPRDPAMQKKLNLRIKFREGFRPFAPSVLKERAAEYFDLECESPYMLLVAGVKESLRKALPSDFVSMEMYERLYTPRSNIPAVTHVDYSARVQTVSKETNPAYWELINAFERRTGCGLVVNTSFNVRGEPIVCTPKDAYLCFMQTDMDALVMEDCLFLKEDQPPLPQNAIREYMPD